MSSELMRMSSGMALLNLPVHKYNSIADRQIHMGEEIDRSDKSRQPHLGLGHHETEDIHPQAQKYERQKAAQVEKQHRQGVHFPGCKGGLIMICEQQVYERHEGHEYPRQACGPVSAVLHRLDLPDPGVPVLVPHRALYRPFLPFRPRRPRAFWEYQRACPWSSRRPSWASSAPWPFYRPPPATASSRPLNYQLPL